MTDTITTIPLDFIPLKNDLTDKGLMARFQVMGMKILDKRQTGSDEQLPPTPEGPHLAFRKKLLTLKDCISKLGRPRIFEYFRKRFQARYPDFRYDGGKVVETPSHLSEAYRLGPNSPEMRSMIFDCLIGIWGSDNGWALTIEQIIMVKLGLQYSSENCNGQPPGKKHKGGSIKHNLVADKQTILAPIRRISQRIYNEMLYKKGRVTLPKGMVCIIDAHVEIHGFKGKLGLYPGHTLLEKTPGVGDSSLTSWFRTQLANGVTTKEELHEAILRDELLGEESNTFVTPPRRLSRDSSDMTQSENSEVSRVDTFAPTVSPLVRTIRLC